MLGMYIMISDDWKEHLLIIDHDIRCKKCGVLCNTAEC